MNILCDGIASWCKKNGAVSEEDYPIVLYGVQVALNSSLKLTGILLIGILLHRFQAALISMVVFCSMRYWTGGWHSKSHAGCFCTMVISCLCPSFLMSLEGGWVAWGLAATMLYSVYRVWRYAPCNSKVNPIKDERLLHRKRIGGILEAVGLLVGMMACPDLGVWWLIAFPAFVNAVMLTL